MYKGEKMISLEKIILDVLNEDNIAGGAESAFGPGVQATATQFSGDNYAPGDARIPKSLFGGIVTRKGLIKNRKKRKKIKTKKR
jgi:hypothetical protein